MTTTMPPQAESETLVNRILAELSADPAAQDMLMKALLSGEFLGMPLRLERVEKMLSDITARLDVVDTRLDHIDTRLDRLEEWQRRTEEWQRRTEEWQRRTEEWQQRTEEWQQRTEVRLERLETTVSGLVDIVGELAGDSFEVKLSSRIIPILSQRIGLRRPQIIRSPVQAVSPELFEQLADAVDENLIDERQRGRILETDIIVHAQIQPNRTWIWIAVEASRAIHQRDIDRARRSADALATVFGEDAMAVAVGQRIADAESRHAQTIGVEVALVGSGS